MIPGNKRKENGKFLIKKVTLKLRSRSGRGIRKYHGHDFQVPDMNITCQWPRGKIGKRKSTGGSNFPTHLLLILVTGMSITYLCTSHYSLVTEKEKCPAETSSSEIIPHYLFCLLFGSTPLKYMFKRLQF